MTDRTPLDLADERRDRNRNVGQHEEREGEGVEDLLRRRALDALPFGRHRDRAEQEQACRDAAQGQPENAAQNAHRAVCNEGRLRQARHAYDDGQREHRDGEQVAGRDRHQHIVAAHALSAAARAAAQQRAGILRVDLIEALAPAQTLVPGLLELLRLLVVDDCLAAVADTAGAR